MQCIVYLSGETKVFSFSWLNSAYKNKVQTPKKQYKNSRKSMTTYIKKKVIFHYIFIYSFSMYAIGSFSIAGCQ